MDQRHTLLQLQPQPTQKTQVKGSQVQWKHPAAAPNAAQKSSTKTVFATCQMLNQFKDGYAETAATASA